MRALLDAGADPHAMTKAVKDPRGKHIIFGAASTLDYALIHKDAEHGEATMLVLLAARDESTVPTRVALDAAKKNMTRVWERWIDKGTVDVNLRGPFGIRPLHSAAHGRATETIQLLTAHGADVHARCRCVPDYRRDNSLTALAVAVTGIPFAVGAKEVSVTTIRALLDASADPSAAQQWLGRDYDGVIALAKSQRLDNAVKAIESYKR